MKTDYTELINQLKSAAISCPDEHKFEIGGLLYFAAVAIEELQAEVNEQKQIAAHYEQTAKDYWKEACDYKTAWEVEREDRLKIEPPQEVQDGTE